MLEAGVERLRRGGRCPGAFERGDRHEPRFLRTVLEPSRDRCVRSIELQEQNRVVAAASARTLQVCACIIGPLELLCGLGCTQPGAHSIVWVTQSVREALPPLHGEPVLT